MSTGGATGVMTGWRRSARPAGSLSGAALLAVIVLAVCGKLLFDLVSTPADLYSIGRERGDS